MPTMAEFDAISLEKCEQKCTESDACRSFEFHSEELRCSLKSVDSQPFGQGILSKDSQLLAHYQRICLKTDHVCKSSAHSFERHPQNILAGHALEVLAVKDLAECLTACLEAKHLFQIDCRSAMFFYREGQCLLNAEHRKGVAGDGIFRAEIGADTVVDYFDNVCADVECFDGVQMHWIRTEHFLAFDPSREVILHDMSLENCKQICIENRVHSLNFPCRAFVHSGNVCHLSAESALKPANNTWERQQKKKKLKKQRRETKIDLHTSFALDDGNGKIPLDSELSPFSAGEYFEKICLSQNEIDDEKTGTIKKLECNDEASFQLFPAKALISAEKKIYNSRSISDCLSKCLLVHAETSDCLSVQFDRHEEKCTISAHTQLTSNNPENFRPSPNVDYFENLCVPIPNGRADDVKSVLLQQTETEPSPLAEEKASEKQQNEMIIPPGLDKRETQESKEKKKKKKERPVMLNAMEEGEEQMAMNKEEKAVSNNNNNTENVLFVEDAKESDDSKQQRGGEAVQLDTECRLSAIKVRATFARPSSGTLFLRDRATACSTAFRGEMNATLLLMSSSQASSSSDANDDEKSSKTNCTGQQIGPHLWAFVIVLRQKENSDSAMDTANADVGNAFHLLTGQERLFNVTCDFSNTTISTKKARKKYPRFEENGALNDDNGNLANESNSSSFSPTSPPEMMTAMAKHKSSTNTKPIVLQMALLRRGHPVNDAVSLGEELELRWSFEGAEAATDDEIEAEGDLEQKKTRKNNGHRRLGMFVDSCIAERLPEAADRQSPADPSPPLPLIVAGCPDGHARAAHLLPAPISPRPDGGMNTTLRVFRFDGSRRVRIRCVVDICVEKCPPANCSNVDAFAQRPFEGEGVRKRRKRRNAGTQHRRLFANDDNDDNNGDDVALTTLSELAELVDKYDRLKSAAGLAGGGDSAEFGASIVNTRNLRQKGGGNNNNLVQQSTTISGSYTIAQEEAEQLAHQQQKQRQKLLRTGDVNGNRPAAAEEADVDVHQQNLLDKRPSSNKLPDRMANQPQQQQHQFVPNAVPNAASDDEEGIVDLRSLLTKNGKNTETVVELPIPFAGASNNKKQNKQNIAPIGIGQQSAECDDALFSADEQRRTSTSICLNRPFVASFLIFFAALATLQLYQLIQHIRRQKAKKERKVAAAEEINLPEPHPPPPSMDDSFDQRIRAGPSYRRQNSGASLCWAPAADDCCAVCLCPPNFCQCRHKNQNNGMMMQLEESNRRQSYISIETPTIARPIPHPRNQTVFPAEAFNSNANARNSITSTRGRQQNSWEHISF